MAPLQCSSSRSSGCCCCHRPRPLCCCTSTRHSSPLRHGRGQNPRSSVVRHRWLEGTSPARENLLGKGQEVDPNSSCHLGPPVTCHRHLGNSSFSLICIYHSPPSIIVIVINISLLHMRGPWIANDPKPLLSDVKRRRKRVTQGPWTKGLREVPSRASISQASHSKHRYTTSGSGPPKSTKPAQLHQKRDHLDILSHQV